MRVVVEPGHEEDTVDAHLPLGAEHGAAFLPEGARTCRLLAGLLGVDEDLGFGEAETNETDTDREASSDPEDSLPRLGGATNTEVGTGGDNVAKGVALLHDAGHETASIGPEFVRDELTGKPRNKLTGIVREPWQLRFRKHHP